MRRHRHLHDAHPRPYLSGHERRHEMELVHGCQREAGHQLSSSARTCCRCSGGNEDGAGGPCGCCRRNSTISNGSENLHEATGVALTPHASFSPISFYSAHASAHTSGAAETTTATSTSTPPPKAFYDGPSLRDSIPTLLARLGNAVAPSSSRDPASTRSYEQEAKKGTCKGAASSLSPRPIAIPQRSRFRRSEALGDSVSAVRRTGTMKADAPSRSSRPPPDDIPPCTVRPERIQASRYEVRQPNAKGKTNRRMRTRAQAQVTNKEVTAVSVNPQELRVEMCPRRCVAMQRPAVAPVPPHASKVSTERDAAAVILDSAPERYVESPTSYQTVVSSRSSAEETCDASSANVASSGTSSSCFGSRGPCSSPRQRRPSYSDSAANAVARKQPEVDPEAAVVAATDRCLVEASREAPRTASEHLPPPQTVFSSSMNSTSGAGYRRISPSRMRGIFAFALSNSSHNSDPCSSDNSGAGVKRIPPGTSRDKTRLSANFLEGMSSRAANPRPPEQKPSHTIKSPFVLLQPMKGVPASSHSISCPSEYVATMDPFAAAVQEAGDPLVLRHTTEYLLSKARRLEKENQRLWWEAHSWDPRRARESREPHPVACPLAYRRACTSSSPMATATCTPAVAPSNTVAPTQAQHLPAPHSRVFVKRQPRLSQATGRSASWTSTPSLSEVSPRCSSVGEGDTTNELSSATPNSHLCTVPVSSPSVAADTLKAQSTKSTRATATSAVSRAEVGMQCRLSLRDAATDATEYRSSEHCEVVSAAETPQHVSSSPHADASAQTEFSTPSASALLRTPDARHQALQHRSRRTESENGRGICAATPTASTVHRRHSIDSDRSLGAIVTHPTPLQCFPLLQKQRRCLSSSSSHVQMAGTSLASASLASRGRLPTYSKQVQTARIHSPSVDEAEDVRWGSGGGDPWMGSFKDRTASVPSSERTAVIELHTSTSYTQSTVSRLREYCRSLDVMRQQLRRRLLSVRNSSTASAVTPSCMQTLWSRSSSRGQVPPAPPTTAATTLSRPFFTSEYADPEVDATLHDIDETAAVETMIVLHEDGAGTITKRILDNSHSCISSSARSSSPQAQRSVAATAPSPTSKYNVAVAGSAASRVRRLSPLRLRGIENTEVVGEEPRARWFSSSLRSDSNSCCSVPVVHLGKRTRSTSASSLGASGPHIRLPGTVPLTPSLSSSLWKESPSGARFVVPPAVPFEGDEVKQLPSPPLCRSGQVAPRQVSGPQAGVTNSRTTSSRKVKSQRFAVREVSQSMSSEHSTPRGSKCSCSSASSEGLVPAEQAASSTAVVAVAAPPWDPTCHSLRSQSPVVFSTAAAASADAAPLVSDRFVTPVTSSMGEADVCGASSHSFDQPCPIATSPRTVACNASLSPLSAPEPNSETSPPPVTAQGQQDIRCPLSHPHLEAPAVRCDHGGGDGQRDLDGGSLDASEDDSLTSSTSPDPERENGGRCKRSETTAFFDEEERREACTASCAGACLEGVLISVMESEVISPNGADHLQSSEPAVSSPRSVERASELPSPARLEELLPLQSQRPAPQRLISPSPPRGAAAGDNVQNPRHGSTDLKAIPHESALQDADIDSSSPQHRLKWPPHHSPVAPPRLILMTKDEDSSSSADSSLSRSLHSLPSTLSERTDGNDFGGEGDDEGKEPRCHEWF
ncbi:hypothetical protein CUR178_01383 [Leishmania enriettii]|uniref:Uncharacterized protein n=1 Tax=Leishmania enriettii TaxID=5663 RepID=A0A836H0F0_LEIEN|nr:hypothetical protein CUR178_01383 [Leishmania enriettii]